MFQICTNHFEGLFTYTAAWFKSIIVLYLETTI